MAINVRQNPWLHGIRPPTSQEEPKLSQYADDTTQLPCHDQSIHEVFKTFELNEHTSGAKINKGKCKGLWCGAFKHRTEQLGDFHWFNDFIPDKLLRQFIGNVDCTRRNWEVRFVKINYKIAAWRHRELSDKGKALEIYGLLTSTLWYNAMIFFACAFLGNSSNKRVHLQLLLELQAPLTWWIKTFWPYLSNMADSTSQELK